MLGQDSIQAPYTVEERVPHYIELFEHRGLAGSIEYFLVTLRAFANAAKNTLARGQDAYGSANAIANLKMVTDFAAMDRAMRTIWTEDQFLASQYASKWNMINAYATNFNASITQMNSWAARADITWAKTEEIAAAVQEGNLESPAITPELKADYIRQAYQQGTAFYLSSAAENIRANYTPEDITPGMTPSANLPLYIGLALGAVVLFFAMRKR